ncbi:short-chain dehydrogenase [Zhengella mangrovi]|uniref:Short-chain dehydrogenase n=1 Tax=Zhengella mangrovi TaxID=1982044 RepID=A0A2G1QL05_9HYPH|nr:SDR family oxidoreductase [Zhengella mangrovi]PHP66217.1 short-chain dehydrogenase [Zhengella mangrovi]
MTPGERRRILITGGTAGLGLALARHLAPRHDVMVTGRQASAAVSANLPATCRYVEADLAAPVDAAAAVEAALEQAGWDGLDHAVLNAATGHSPAGGLEDAATIRRTLDVNLVSTLLLARMLHPHLSVRKGLLTLVGSVARRGTALFPAYAASKAGLHGFGRALRSEWRGSVGVQVIHPGPMRTGMHEKAGHDPGPLGRFFLDPADAAAMMAHDLATRRSPVTLGWLRYLSGATFWRPRL